MRAARVSMPQKSPMLAFDFVCLKPGASGRHDEIDMHPPKEHQSRQQQGVRGGFMPHVGCYEPPGGVQTTHCTSYQSQMAAAFLFIIPHTPAMGLDELRQHPSTAFAIGIGASERPHLSIEVPRAWDKVLQYRVPSVLRTDYHNKSLRERVKS